MGIILLYFNSLAGSFAISPNDFTPNAADKFKGPELFPIKNLDFFNAVITPVKSFCEQSTKYFFFDI